MSAKAEANRIRSIEERKTFPVDLGTLPSDAVVVILNALLANARAYRSHPRGRIAAQLAQLLYERTREQMPEKHPVEEVDA